MLDDHKAIVRRGGVLSGGKSIALSGVELHPPAMTKQDCDNIKDAVEQYPIEVIRYLSRTVKSLR